MSIRFKFRSSVNFDVLDIEGRPSISVREFRDRILRAKSVGVKHDDFDLVLSDAASNQEYKDENVQIPSGSSVIVKRVPAATAPSAMMAVETANKASIKDAVPLHPPSEPAEKFSDFGTNICLVPDTDFLEFGVESDKNNFRCNGTEDITGLRCPLSTRLGHQQLGSTDNCEAIPRGSNQGEKQRNGLQELKVEEQLKSAKPSSADFLAAQNANLPSELKCPLCKTYFKEAVMIPCCQHSFCEKCIRLVLFEKAKCPKCCSSKCKVENLLPNLSLRQAIEHFLESQMIEAGGDAALQKYAPDGESGIHGKEVSCALTVAQREQEFPQSSSVTGKASNQISMDPYLLQEKVPYGYPTPDDFQGESQPFRICQDHIQDGADSNNNRKRAGAWFDARGGDQKFWAHGAQKKGGRNCYTCGSPDHLMRDCPGASNPHSMFQPGNGAFHGGIPGYPPPYWAGPTLSPFRPYGDMYNNPAMMPFNASMVPSTPFPVPQYLPSMYAGFPGPGGNMRMGNMGPPAGSRAERHPTHYGHTEPQCRENKTKHSHEHLRSEQFSDEEVYHDVGHWQNKAEKSRDRPQRKKESSLSNSEDSFTRRSRRKSQHEKFMDPGIRYSDDRHDKSSRSYRSDRSNSGVEQILISSDRHSEGRHKYHDGDSKKHHERRGQSDSDSSLSRPRRVESDVRSSHRKHHLHLERDTGHDSRHSRHTIRHTRDEPNDNRWHMVKGSHENYRDDYRHSKRKKVEYNELG